jgi:hypothetical protein
MTILKLTKCQTVKVPVTMNNEMKPSTSKSTVAEAAVISTIVKSNDAPPMLTATGGRRPNLPTVYRPRQKVPGSAITSHVNNVTLPIVEDTPTQTIESRKRLAHYVSMLLNSILMTILCRPHQPILLPMQPTCNKCFEIKRRRF